MRTSDIGDSLAIGGRQPTNRNGVRFTFKVTLDQLRPIAEALQRLHSRVEDTLAALGHDIMDVALDGYGQLKLSGAAHGLDDLRRDLGARFSRTRRKEAAEAVA